MKILITILLFSCLSTGVLAQNKPTQTLGNKNVITRVLGDLKVDSGVHILKQGGPITSLPQIGINPNTIDIVEWIDKVFYQSQPPLITVTGAKTYELQSAKTITENVQYTITRQFATEPIESIKIDGVAQTFTQPAKGNSVSGEFTVSFPANTNKTFQIVATTVDGKTAITNVNFNFLPKRYWGWLTPEQAEGIDLPSFDDSKITALNNELSASRIIDIETGDPNGSKIFVYAYYATAGDLIIWDMNRFASIEAMNKVTRNFTNALGFTGQWKIYYSRNAQKLQSSIIAR